MLRRAGDGRFKGLPTYYKPGKDFAYRTLFATTCLFHASERIPISAVHNCIQGLGSGRCLLKNFHEFSKYGNLSKTHFVQERKATSKSSKSACVALATQSDIHQILPNICACQKGVIQNLTEQALQCTDDPQSLLFARDVFWKAQAFVLRLSRKNAFCGRLPARVELPRSPTTAPARKSVT